MDRIRLVDGGCILWLGHIPPDDGYGRMSSKDGKCLAHVYAFVRKHGQVPKGLQVNHTCHVRHCVNDAHLYAGTQKNNVDDMLNAGRRVDLRGSQKTNAKLTEAVVLEVLRSDGPSHVAAGRFGISSSLVRQIRNGRLWRHVARELV